MHCLNIMSLCVVLASEQGKAFQGRVRVDATGEGLKVSPHLYGIFFEEVNHAGDGGLYAELVRNRDFEEARAPEGSTIQGKEAVTAAGFRMPFDASDPHPGWSLVCSPGAQGEIAAEKENPLNPVNPISLRVEVREQGSGRVGIANGGYWGIPVRKGESYRLSLWARALPPFQGPLALTIENEQGEAMVRSEIKGLSQDWQRFEQVLKSRGTDSNARLVISSASPGVFWLDVVSLFPTETWKGRSNGLRPDLAQLLADLRPAFVRFPGGCFVEGISPDNAFRWKKTIGDIVGRPGHWCLWNYHSTDGLGYHEYLEMCEDLGAAAMFVVNCGMSCRGRGGMLVPEEDLSEWVQDALDAIEYAIGPATSKWGQVRVENGHPEPFDLQYVEIGNENSGPEYAKRYVLFYEAIKARYPQVELIANVPVEDQPMDILDEHYYSSPEFFTANAQRYDAYDRKGPKIYVGEYACTKGCGRGNLKAALGEAAFMTGMERNADIVVMASYAPLFVNVRDRCWNPDLIAFDGSHCYGIPSYHVQRLFAENRPDLVFPTEVQAAGENELPSGQIGLGTWETQAEFKEVKVCQGVETLFEEDFSKGSGTWQPWKGTWTVVKGCYQQSDPGPDARSLAGDRTWQDYVLSLKARKISGKEGFLILFHVKDKDNFFWWNIGGWGNQRHGVEWANGSRQAVIGNVVEGHVETGQWYDVRIELAGDRIRCFLDGAKLHDFSVPRPGALYAVAGRDLKTDELVLKVVNVAEDTCQASIEIEGIETLESRGRAITLTSQSPDDENSLDCPDKVVAKTGHAEGLGVSFSYAFPAYSVTVIRSKAAW